jgi:hypothetical protein
MNIVKLIQSHTELQQVFDLCCKEYDSIEMYVAWVGNPKNIVPFNSLENLKTVKAFIGIAFDQSSPEGIEHLMNSNCDLTIVNSSETYHPKLYFFKSKTKTALLIGSSNFTYSGFVNNIEANVLLEGKQYQSQIENYLKEIRKIVSTQKCFKPTTNWLRTYKQNYLKRQIKFKKDKVKDEALREDILAQSNSWLGSADWNIYFSQINNGLIDSEKRFKEGLDVKIKFFNECSETLATPWRPKLFNSIENRRIILGSSGYGWLGHVGASGRIRQLLASGTIEEHRTICNAINKIASLEQPLNYNILKLELQKLQELGPSIKVWSRLLAITRPDLYCTISAPSVRLSLSILLDKPQTYFMTNDGYVDLLQLIHQSPWFNATRPNSIREKEIWQRRVAFLDVVFY